MNAIVRPPRAEYTIAELGPTLFDYAGARFVREDSTLTNPRGMTLHCSFWRRADLAEPAPCVVYTHGNASCRAEALQILAPVLASGASVFSFDFAGCGHSQGDFISLGWFEKDDLQTALTHLREGGFVGAIMLWGRSMGASSAVLQASRDPSLAGLVLDSPFASLEQVALELVTSAPETVPGAPNVPPFLVKTALRVVAGTVKSRAGFDLYKLRPVEAARTCFVPALFGCAADDVLVRPHHSQLIFDEYAGDKNVVRFEGDHNDIRPGFFLDSACIFLKQVLLIPEAACLDAPLDARGRPLSFAAALRVAYRPAPRQVEARQGANNLLGNNHLGNNHAMQSMDDYEEELLQQAIAQSLAMSAEPAGEAPAPAPAEAQELEAEEEAAPLASVPATPSVEEAAAAEGVQSEFDEQLQQAIAMSLAAEAAPAEAAPEAPAQAEEEVDVVDAAPAPAPGVA